MKFSANRPQYKFSGERSALAVGAWVITGVQHTPAWMATVAIFGQDAYSWFHSAFASGATPKTEIIVTVSVSDAQRYVARSTCGRALRKRGSCSITCRATPTT